MLLTLSSTNPRFSYIIGKNPATIADSGEPFFRSLRQGRLTGWFVNNQTFRLWFKDSDYNCSFSDAEFEYLDTTRYLSPMAVLSVIQTALRSASRDAEGEDVPGFSASLEFVCSLRYRIIKGLVASLSDGFQVESIGDENGPWKINITAPTVQEVLSTAIIAATLGCMDDDSIYLPLNREAVGSYLKILARAKVPYYVWHLFVQKAITNREMLEDHRELLAASGFTFKFGNTQTQRADAIKKALRVKSAADEEASGDTAEYLVDIGCGELFHSSKLSNHYSGILAIDKDPDICEANQGRVKNRSLGDKVFPICADVTTASAETWGNWVTPNSDVLMSEFLEHVERDDALKVLAQVLAQSPHRVVVTCPNADFNVNYWMEKGEFRHRDHLWEPTTIQFYEFVQQAAGFKNFNLTYGQNGEPNVLTGAGATPGEYTVELINVGDLVNGISPTVMAVLTRI